MQITFPGFSHCKLYIGSELIMFTESSPVVDLEKKRIFFSEINVKEMFSGKYLGSDFTIELHESGVTDQPTVFFYESGIMNFGMLELIQHKAGRFIKIKNMEFEYDWVNDTHERFMKLIDGEDEELPPEA